MARARPHVLGPQDSGHTHTLKSEASGCGEVGKDCAGEGPVRTEVLAVLLPVHAPATRRAQAG